MPIDPKEIYDRERRERLANLAPRRDAGPVSEADIWRGERDKAAAARVRQHKIDDLSAFTRKKYGRDATQQEIADYLNEGGAA
jgi:hypothetical protein